MGAALPDGSDRQPVELVAATAEHRERLVGLMTEFYTESGFALNPSAASAAFLELLTSPDLGRVWLIRRGDRDAGYIVLTLGFSLEYGGRDGFVDDLFIREPFRGQGLGTTALETLRREARALGVRALHLEVGRDNHPAQALYRRAGFRDNERQLLTLPLAEPTHDEP